MAYGSVLANYDEIQMESADGQIFQLKNNFFTKIAFKILGLPHIEERLRVRRIFSFLPKKGNGEKLLDAGCGFGIYSLTLEKKGYKIYSVDIDQKRIDFLKKGSENINASKQDLRKLSFNKEGFDIIICSDVIEHIKEDKIAFKELSRVLKKGGILCLSTPSNSLQNQKNYKRYGHERVGYKINDIKKLAKENNLKIIDIKPYSGKLVEKAFEINEKIYKNKVILGLLFYPLYLSVFIEDLFKLYKKHYNGVAYKLIKN